MQNPQKAKLRMSIFIPMSIIFLSAIVLGLVAPKAFYDVENAIVQFSFEWFGWLFQLSGNVFLGICLWLAFGKFGDIRLGGRDAKPTMSFWNWFAISLCAGIATGILFWGIAEPITHFMKPPKPLGLEPGSEAAAMFSMTQTFIHWTYLPYGMYALAGIGIAYATYNMNQEYQVSSILYPVFGEKIHGAVGSVVDNICLFAMAGGVAAVLGVATTQIGAGLEYVFGIKSDKTLWVIIVGAIVLSYVVSSYTGMDKGIRWLSDKNSKLFIGMLVFFFIFGAPKFILPFGTQSLGHFIQNFFERTLYTSPVDGHAWPRWWPIYYWAIWLAYAPLVGMFLARISKGRTVKQFMLVNLGIPATFGLLWFSVFGGNAINLQMSGIDIAGVIADKGLEVSVFEFLKHYPLTTVMSVLFMVAVFVSVVTLADSMTTTVSALSTTAHNSAEVEPPTQVKFFWGGIMSSIAIINLLAGQEGQISGIDATKQIATVAGFPTLFLMFLIAFCVIKMFLQREKYDVAYFSGKEGRTIAEGRSGEMDIAS